MKSYKSQCDASRAAKLKSYGADGSAKSDMPKRAAGGRIDEIMSEMDEIGDVGDKPAKARRDRKGDGKDKSTTVVINVGKDDKPAMPPMPLPLPMAAAPKPPMPMPMPPPGAAPGGPPGMPPGAPPMLAKGGRVKR